PQSPQRQEIGKKVGGSVAARGYLLSNVRRESRIGDDVEKGAQRHHVAPESVGFYAEAAHQNGEGDRSDENPNHTGCSHRQKESAVAHQRTRSSQVDVTIRAEHPVVRRIKTLSVAGKAGASPRLLETPLPTAGR